MVSHDQMSGATHTWTRTFLAVSPSVENPVPIIQVGSTILQTTRDSIYQGVRTRGSSNHSPKE